LSRYAWIPETKPEDMSAGDTLKFFKPLKSGLKPPAWEGEFPWWFDNRDRLKTLERQNPVQDFNFDQLTGKNTTPEAKRKFDQIAEAREKAKANPYYKNPGSPTVVVPELGNEEYKPNDLRCTTCKMLIADHQVYVADKNPYCARCWVETKMAGGIRCFGCDELILAGEYTKAEELSYHLEHFCCNKCDMQLGGHEYVRPCMQESAKDKEDKNPYCKKCYIEEQAPKCMICMKPALEGAIFGDPAGSDGVIHAECFKCEGCKGDIASGFFPLEGKFRTEFYCQKCFTCEGCKKPLEGMKKGKGGKLYCTQCIKGNEGDK